MRLAEDKSAKTLSYYLTDTDCKIGSELIEFLKKELKKNDIVRVSLHSNADELTQSMIIAITKNADIKKHKNVKKDKIYYVIEGEMEFSLEDKKINVKKGEFFKLNKNTFMSLRSLSEIAIYNEMIAGPFKKEDTVYES